MSPKYTGELIEASLNPSSKVVAEVNVVDVVAGTQAVDGSQVVDEAQAVDESQATDNTHNRKETKWFISPYNALSGGGVDINKQYKGEKPEVLKYSSTYALTLFALFSFLSI